MGENLTEKGRRGFFSDSSCVLIITILTIVLFRKALFGPDIILSHPIFLDLTHHVYSLRLYAFGLLKNGVVPLWNPYLMCGMPLVANWHSAVFYPLNSIFLFLPANVALNYSIALHFWLAGVFTYAFVRYLLRDCAAALLSAVTFVFSGPYLVQLFPGHIFNPLPWLPLSLLLAELAMRRGGYLYYLLCGCVLGLQILAGHPQYMLYCLGALILYIIFRSVCDSRERRSFMPVARAAAGIAVILAVGSGLSAVQLLPSMEFKNLSSRALLRGAESVGDVSFPPENLVTLLVPSFFGDMHGVRYWGRWLLWETCMYAGILPLLLAVMGACLRRDRFTYFFASLAVVAAILSFGAYSPLFRFLYAHVPGFAMFRGQAKFIFLASFSISILAGCGFHSLLHSSRGAPIRIFGAVAIVLGAVILAVSVTATAGGSENSPLWQGVLSFRQMRGFEGTPPIHPREMDVRRAAFTVARGGLLKAAFVLLASGGILLASARGRLKGSLLAGVVLLVSLGDLWHYGSKYIMVSPLSSCYWPRDLAGFLRKDHSAFRIAAPNIAVPGANQNMNDGIFAIDGYETTNVGLYKEYVDYSQGFSSERKLTFEIVGVNPMLEALNLKYLLLPAGEPFAREGYRLSFTDGRTAVYERDRCAPRAYIVHEYVPVPDRGEALKILGARGADSVSPAVLAENVPELSGKGLSGAGFSKAVIVASGPNEVAVETSAERPGLLCLRDVYYPGWRAYVDGEEKPVLRADHAFRAVYLPGGIHTVKFRYEPRSFALGWRLSLISLAATVLLLLLAGSRLKNKITAD